MIPLKTIIRTYSGNPEHSSQRVDWAVALQLALADLDATVYMDLIGDPYNHFLSVLKGCFQLDESVVGILHIEDDAILCDRFIEKMQAEVAAHSESIVQFFSKFPGDAEGTSHYQNPRRPFVGGVCFYLPRPLIKHVYRAVANWNRRTLNPTAWDVAIGYWMRELQMDYWLVLPNLADHRVGPSLIDSNRPQDRRSNSFIA